MALPSFVGAKAQVQIGPDVNDFVTVRGLSLADILPLLSKHRGVAAVFFDDLKKEGAKDVSLTDKALSVLTAVPELVCEIIALAMDEPDELAAISKMPMSAQLTLLEAIGAKTFESEGGVGKTMEIVMNMFMGTTRTLNSLRT